MLLDLESLNLKSLNNLIFNKGVTLKQSLLTIDIEDNITKMVTNSVEDEEEEEDNDMEVNEDDEWF